MTALRLAAAMLMCAMPGLFAQARISVDFSTPRPGNKSMIGFLHAADDAAPPDAAIQPLQPQLWRVGNFALKMYDHGAKWPAIYRRVTGFGARVVYVLSDEWSGGSNPFDNWQAWEAFVQKTARANRNRDLIYDVWNEPNLKTWHGTKEQYYEAYVRASRVLRRELGENVWISGPSTDGYRPVWMQGLADYCLAQGCELSVFSWHELNDTNPARAAVADHLKEARRLYINDLKYAALRVKEIQINENVGKMAKHNPAAILSYLYYLEAGGADAAGKSCWDDSHHKLECYNDTLDGLLTAANQKPRSAWWVYKFYSDGVHSRVASATSDARAVAIASADVGQSNGQVLAGFADIDQQGVKHTTIGVDITLHGLTALPYVGQAQAVHVRTIRIRVTGEAPLPQPQEIGEQDVTVRNGVAEIHLAQCQSGDVYRLVLSKRH